MAESKPSHFSFELLGYLFLLFLFWKGTHSQWVRYILILVRVVCFKLSLQEYLFSVATEKRSEILDSASPHTLLSSLSYPQRKQQLLKLTEGLSPSVRHTNTAGKNRPPVFSRTSVCNLGAKLSLTSIDEHICTGFKPQHIFLQSIAKTWPPPAQLTIAAQTVALYLLNCRPPALDHSRALQQKSPSWSIAGSTLHALALTVKFKASCGIQILS